MNMLHPKIVSREEWFELRADTLQKEKDLTRKRDAITAEIRQLPWIKIDKDYTFQTQDGPKKLLDLFEGKSQLVVYHMMFASRNARPCPVCSFWADHFAGLGYHLPQRDTAFKVISRAPLDAITEWKTRLGWTFDWVSSDGSDFNFDLGVFHVDQGESPGLSVFSRDGNEVYQTYFTTGRGLEAINGTYGVLDLVPKGRDEAQLEWPAAWVKRHDEYSK
jgi:predicted dithiol-disulfide oxidoreductase (DUF899 family)